MDDIIYHASRSHPLLTLQRQGAVGKVVECNINAFECFLLFVAGGEIHPLLFCQKIERGERQLVKKH
jgi:hypothetical protein